MSDDAGSELAGKVLGGLLAIWGIFWCIRWVLGKIAEYSYIMIWGGLLLTLIVLLAKKGNALGAKRNAVEKWEKASANSPAYQLVKTMWEMTLTESEDAVRASEEGCKRAFAEKGRGKPVLDSLANSFRETAKRERLTNTELEEEKTTA